MRFKFIGDPNDNMSGPDVLLLAGYEFPRGEYVQVDDALSLKLMNNSHFECEKTGNGSVLSIQDISETEESFVSAIMASNEPTKDRLMSEAIALGLQIDGRWGLSRLQRTVEAARAAGN